ncbi:MAG: MbnP family protein [Flavobacteriales bacterium]
MEDAFNQKNNFTLSILNLHQRRPSKSISPMTSLPSQINFSVGIDSITNVSGVMGGDLDPTKGMYWTWQSGYINFKLESSKITYHLGGYASPYPTIQNFSFKINNQHPHFVFDADKFLSLALLQRKTNIMSPGADAYHIAQYLQNVFSLKE